MNTKNVVVVLLIFFVGFWMFTDPDGLARTAGSLLGFAWQTVQELFRGLIRFLGELG